MAFSPPEGADLVRVVTKDSTERGGTAWVASTGPMGYSTAPLDRIVESNPDILVLASPSLATYFPCVAPPEFSRGVVASPEVLVQSWSSMWQTTFVAAVSLDRYFRIDVETDTRLRSEQIGAHSGDARNLVFVSQAYLSGLPARMSGSFTSITE